MSNSTDKTSCISHKPNSRFFIIYEDYLQIAVRASYEHRHKLAAFWRILETKTNDRITYNEEAEKQGHPKLDLWVEISYSECVSRSLETYKSSSFQVAAAESERLGFSKSKQGKRPINPLDPQSPLEDYKEYLFLTGVMQSVINGGECPTPIEINSPLLQSLSKRKEERKQQKAIKNNTPPINFNSPPVENNTSPLLNLTPGAIKINRKKYREESLKDNKDSEEESNGESTASNAFASSHSFDAALSQINKNDSYSDSTGLQEIAESLIAPTATGTTHPQGDTDGHPNDGVVNLASDYTADHLSGLSDSRAQTPQVAPQEGDTDHADPLPPLPATDHPDGGSNAVPSRYSPVDSPGTPGALDALPVECAQLREEVGGKGQGGDTGRGGSTGDYAHTQRDATNGQRLESETPPSSAVEPGQSAVALPVAPVLPVSDEPHDQDRGEASRHVTVHDSGHTAPAPLPQVLPGVTPPPVHVLIVAQHFTDAEQWKEAHDAFIETLRGVWKQAGSDFKQTYGNWNRYRKQYLDRWKKANPAPTEESLLSLEESRIWKDWQTNYKGPIPLTPSDKQALGMLLPTRPTREDLKACRGWLFTTDDPKKPWYRKIGVSLMDVAKNWGKWQSLRDIPQIDAKQEAPGPKLPPRMPSPEELKRMVY